MRNRVAVGDTDTVDTLNDELRNVRFCTGAVHGLVSVATCNESGIDINIGSVALTINAIDSDMHAPDINEHTAPGSRVTAKYSACNAQTGGTTTCMAVAFNSVTDSTDKLGGAHDRMTGMASDKLTITGTGVGQRNEAVVHTDVLGPGENTAPLLANETAQPRLLVALTTCVAAVSEMVWLKTNTTTKPNPGRPGSDMTLV